MCPQGVEAKSRGGEFPLPSGLHTSDTPVMKQNRECLDSMYIIFEYF